MTDGDYEVCVGLAVGEMERKEVVDIVEVVGKMLVLTAMVLLDGTGYFPAQVWRGTGGCGVRERYWLSSVCSI